MAAPGILHVDAATLFVGDDDPTNSLHMVIAGVKLPPITEKTKDHAPGGGPMAVKLGMRKIEALEPTFKAAGINPTVKNKLFPFERTMYTMRANIRDVTNQIDIPMKAIISGRLMEVDIGELGTDDAVDTSYKISEVMYYQVFLGNTERWYFNFPEGYAGVRIDGVQVFRQVAANLGLV